jgi:hypothetical protein
MANWQKNILDILKASFDVSPGSSGLLGSVYLRGTSSEYSVISFSYPFKGFSGLFLSEDLVGYDFSRVLDVLLNNSIYVQGLSSTMYFRPGILFDSPENSSVRCDDLTTGLSKVVISISAKKDDNVYLFFPGRVFKGTLSEISKKITSDGSCSSASNCFAEKIFKTSGDTSILTIKYYPYTIVLRVPSTVNSGLSNGVSVGSIFVLGLLYVPVEDAIYPAMAVPYGDGYSFYVFVRPMDNVFIGKFHYLTTDDLDESYPGSGIESLLGYFKNTPQSNSLLDKVLSFYSYPWSVRRDPDKTLIEIRDYTENLQITSVGWAITPQKDYFIPLALISVVLEVKSDTSGSASYYYATVSNIGSLTVIPTPDGSEVSVQNGFVNEYKRGVLVAPKYGKHISSDVFGLGDILGFSDIPGDNLLNALTRIKSAIVSTVGEAVSSDSTYVYGNKKLLALDDDDNRLSIDLISTLSLGSGFRDELEIFDSKTYPETVVDVLLKQDIREVQGTRKFNISDLNNAIQSAIRDTTKVKTVRLRFYTEGQKYLDIYLDNPFNSSDPIISDSYGSVKFPMYTIPLPKVPRIILDFSYYSYVRFSIYSSSEQKMNELSSNWGLQIPGYNAISRFALVFKITGKYQYVELYGLNHSSNYFPVKIAIGHDYTYNRTDRRYSLIKVKNCYIRDFDIFGSKGYSYTWDGSGNKYRIYHYPNFDFNSAPTNLFFYDVYLSIENSTVRVYPYGYIASNDNSMHDGHTDFYSGYMIGWWPGCEPVNLYLETQGG